MSNYYVRRNHDYDDELAHSLGGWLKRRAQGAHKYIAKIPIGGKMRYFYTQAELAAYKAGKTVGKAATNVKNRLTVTGAQGRYAVKRIGDTARAKVVNAVNNATGASAKRQMQTAKDKLTYEQNRMRSNRGNKEAYNTAKGAAITRQRAYDETKSKYDRSLLGRVEAAGRAIGGAANRARNAAEGAAGKVRGAAGRARDAVADASGYNKRKAAQLKTNYANGLSRSKVYDPEAQRTARVARKEYNRSPLGRLEGAANAVGSAVSGAGSKISKGAKNAKKAVTGAASSAGRAVTKTAKRAGTTVANATGYSERQRSQRMNSYANRRSASGNYDPEAHRQARRATASYNRTPMGRIEGAARAVGSAANSVRRGATGAANSARRGVTGAVNSANAAYNDWRKKRYLKRQSKKGANA